jgi:outer membrane protein TolC
MLFKKLKTDCFSRIILKAALFTIGVCPQFFPTVVQAQHSLDEIIDRAQNNSYASRQFDIELQLAKAKYRSFIINYKPLLTLSGNIPAFNKDNIAVVQPDGSVAFRSRSQTNSNVSFGFTKPITFSGGTISVNTDLTRFDDLVRKTTRYNGTPLFIRLNQPLFAFNALKWDKKIEPLKLQEATSTYKQRMNELAYEVCNLYFDVAEAHASQQLAETNLAHTNTNFEIEKKRFDIGTSIQDRVSQLELQRLLFLQQRYAATIALREASINLNSLLNDGDTAVIQLALPEKIPAFIISREEIIEKAKRNLPLYLSFDRKKLESSANIAKAKSASSVNLSVSYGLTNAEDNIPAIYRHPNNQQRLSIGLTIPVADWGRRRVSIETAKLFEKQVDVTNKIEEQQFVTEVTNLVNRLPFLKANVLNAFSIDTLAAKRYLTANRLYELGKISLLELQASFTEKDNAKRNYIYSLRLFWEAYYLLKVKIGE